MELPFKLFYSLDELVQYGWRGFASVEEILHAAAVGMIPIYVRTEKDFYCHRRTAQQHAESILSA